MASSVKLPSISDFKLIKPISRGAFGKVFLATKCGGNTLYAIKIVSKEEMKRKNLVDKVTAERNALAVSKCPYIVHLYYSLQSISHIYLVMEYLIGGDLKTLLLVLGYLRDIHAAIYTVEISIALEYLHSHGIIHRDLKPDNILITAAGHLKLTDFGLSTLSWNRPIQASDVLNTPSVRSLPTEYYRTPGQLLSLTSELSFADFAHKHHTPGHLISSVCDVESTDGFHPSTLPSSPDRHLERANEMEPEPGTLTRVNLLTHFDEDTRRRQEWRHAILKALDVVQSQNPESLLSAGLLPAFMSPKTSNSQSQRPVSLSDIIHEDSLLTLSELFAGADPREMETIKSFVAKLPPIQLLRARLLVRQFSVPGLSSPPPPLDWAEHTESASSDRSVSDFGLTDFQSHFGPVRRCKSYTHALSSKPYRLRRGRRLYCFPWSPTMFNDPQNNLNDNLRRLTLPPLPKSPEPNHEMDCEKENLLLISRGADPGDVQDGRFSNQITHHTGRMLQSPVSVRFEDPPHVMISPVRSELSNLHLTSESSNGHSDVGEIRPPELPLSASEKSRLQQLYSPAPVSLEELQYGTNLAEVDPSHPCLPCASRSPFHADTPMRTPRLLRRHGLPALSKTQLFGVPKIPASSTIIRDMNSSFVSVEHNFGKDQKALTPLSVIVETEPVSQHLTPPASNVKFFSPCIQPPVPPSSPVCPSCPNPGDPPNVFPRLLGTPEYIAPELLAPLSSSFDNPETPAVDWWALGVILFEMLTGSTPFADETPEAVFQNVLNLDIPWPAPSSSRFPVSGSSDSESMGSEPQELSSEAVELISALLSRAPSDRIAAAGRLRTCGFLAPVGDWSRLNELEMPFVPCPDSSTDTSYFQVRNEMNEFNLTCSTVYLHNR